MDENNENEQNANRQRRHGPAPNEFISQPVFDTAHQNVEVLSAMYSSAALTSRIETAGLDVTSMAMASEDVPSFARAGIFQVIVVKPSNRNFTAQQYSRSQNNSRSNQASDVNYDVAIYVRDVLSNDPSLCVIFHGRNVNPDFFSADYGARSHIMSKLLKCKHVVTRLPS